MTPLSTTAAARRQVATAATVDTARVAEMGRLATARSREARSMLEDRQQQLAQARARLQILLQRAGPRLVRTSSTGTLANRDQTPGDD